MSKMKQELVFVAAFVLVFAALLSGCAASGAESASTSAQEGSEASVSSSAAGSSAASSASEASSATLSTYAYLGEIDGYVVIYESDKTEPVEVTELAMGSLDDTATALVRNHVSFATVEDARKQVRNYELEAARAQGAAEEAARQAQARADEQARAQAAAQAQQQAEAAAAAAAASAQSGAQSPFWGVWIGAFKNSDNAYNFAAEASSKGYAAEVLISTDWDNLNPEFFYVVTVGRYSTRDAAEAALPSVHAQGYSDAYVKHSGNHR